MQISCKPYIMCSDRNHEFQWWYKHFFIDTKFVNSAYVAPAKSGYFFAVRNLQWFSFSHEVVAAYQVHLRAQQILFARHFGTRAVCAVHATVLMDRHE